MSKPLELTVYPKLERPLWGHQIEGYRQQVKAESALKESKRLTDAELAAEYWEVCHHGARAHFNEVSSECEYSEGFWGNHFDRLNALYRFATLPRYDEPQS